MNLTTKRLSFLSNHVADYKYSFDCIYMHVHKYLIIMYPVAWLQGIKEAVFMNIIFSKKNDLCQFSSISTKNLGKLWSIAMFMSIIIEQKQYLQEFMYIESQFICSVWYKSHNHMQYYNISI